MFQCQYHQNWLLGTVFQAIVAVLASKMKDGGKWKAFVEGNSDFVECVVRVTHHPFQKRNTQQIQYLFQKSLRISFHKSVTRKPWAGHHYCARSPPAAAESCGGGQLSLCVAPLQQEGKPKNLDHPGDHHLNTVTVDGMDRCGIICCSLQGNEALASSSVDTGYLSRGELSPGSPSCSSGWTRKRIIIMKWGGCWEIKFYTMVERKRTTWEKSLLRRHAAPMKWNNKLDSSNKTNKSETWWPNQFNNLCNTSGAAHPISFLPILLSFVFKEYTAEHFSLFSAQTYLFLPLYTFSLTIDGMFLWVTGSYNIWLCCSNIDTSGWYVWMRRISGWGSALSLSDWRGAPSHPFPWCLYFDVALFLETLAIFTFLQTLSLSFRLPLAKMNCWAVKTTNCYNL